MTLQYRICHNCGASLTPDQAYCPRCGAQYIEQVIQEPGAPLPPQQAQVPYQPQGQSYAQSPTSSPNYPSNYGQQAQMTPGQVGGSPEPPPPQSRKGVSPFLIIAIVVVALLLLVGTGSLFYNLGQRNSPQPGTTPIPGITPAPTPTQGTTATPTSAPQITPQTTPTATSLRVPGSSTTVSSLSVDKALQISVPYVLFHSQWGGKWTQLTLVCPIPNNQFFVSRAQVGNLIDYGISDDQWNIWRIADYIAGEQ